MYSDYIWSLYTEEKKVYLSFDDGPEPEVTPWVLDQLAKYNAKATFFCLGKNACLYPDIVESIIQAGHSIGNHTFDHLNGWKTNNSDYFDNIHRADPYTSTHLFRPPYGRLKRAQRKELIKKYTIVMWDLLAGDFDKNISPKACLDNVIKNTENGSIIVLHDSIKAKKNLEYVLPRILNYFCAEGFEMNAIPSDIKHS